MSILEGIVLGVVQGLTEFLPVSSSGHLIVVRELFGWELSGTLAFDAVLHLATALVIIVYFWRDIVAIIRERQMRLLGALVVGSVPAALLGVSFEAFIEEYTRSAAVVSVALILGSVLFVIAERCGKGRRSLTAANAFAIGCFQALALIPGFSRAGSSIAGGLLLGLPRTEAVRFAFLLGIPVLVGAGGMKLFDALSGGGVAPLELAPLFSGAVAAIVVGFLSVHWLVRFLRTGTLVPFAIYRTILAIVTLALAL